MASPAVILTEEDKAEFFQVGFVVKPNLFTKDEVEDMLAAFDNVKQRSEELIQTAADLNKARPTVFDESGARFTYQPLPKGDNAFAIRHVAWCGLCEPTLRDFGVDPRVLSIAAQLLDLGPNDQVDQIINQAHYKEPGDGVRFDWHQDSHHRRMHFGDFKDVNGKGSYVQVIIALDEVTLDNGPLKFIPKSCQRGHIGADKGLDPNDVDESKEAIPLCKPGDVLAFGPYTIHGSEENIGSGPRRAFINGFSSPGAQVKEPFHHEMRSLASAFKQD